MMEFLRDFFGVAKCTSDATLITLLGVMISSATIIFNIVGKQVSKGRDRKMIREKGRHELQGLIGVLNDQGKSHEIFAESLNPNKAPGSPLAQIANPYIEIWKEKEFY